jgi:acyl carrier protein phosphodiesterase
MNFLAHLYFSDGTPESVLGSLLGDFVKGRPGPGYSPAVVRGIVKHRAIDSFTDGHRAVRRSERCISARRRRYAGILVDIFYDHFLCRHWQRFSDVPLADFIRSVYGAMRHYDGDLPHAFDAVLDRIIRQDWLSRYQTREGLAATIDRVAQRINRANPLEGGIEELDRDPQRLNAHFLEFFPELVAYVESYGDSTGTAG